MITVDEVKALLTGMVDAARVRDTQALMELKDSSELMNDDVSALLGDYFVPYDNCRQSCLFAMTMPDKHDDFVADAEKRLAEFLEHYQ